MNVASFVLLSIQLKLFKKIPTTPRFSTNPERRLHLPFKGLGKKCILPRLPSTPNHEWGLICPWMEWMEVPNAQESQSWTLMPPTLYCCSYSETMSLKWVSKASKRPKNQFDRCLLCHQPIKSFFPFNSLDALDFFVWSLGLFDKPRLEASNAQQSYLRESENPWTLWTFFISWHILKLCL